MAGVAFVFVREDASDAETLAEALDVAGYSITATDETSAPLGVVLWSRAALRSDAFRAAAERALRSDNAIVASLAAPPEPARVLNATIVDLSAWDGEDELALEPLIDAADALTRPARPHVIALPPFAYEDAEFTEAQPLGAASAHAERARRSWEAPIPLGMLTPVREEPREPKLGAPSPRRDFRRIRPRERSRAPSALAFIGVALIGAGVFAAAIQPPVAPPPQERVERSVGGMSLTSAAANSAELEDFAPIEPPSLFEPPLQRGHAGVEPPSAPVHRASYRRRGH